MTEGRRYRIHADKANRTRRADPIHDNTFMVDTREIFSVNRHLQQTEEIENFISVLSLYRFCYCRLQFSPFPHYILYSFPH